MAQVTFLEERCKGCKLCTAVCKQGIVVMKEDELNSKGFHPAGITDMEKCTGCTFCAMACPDCVITINN